MPSVGPLEILVILVVAILVLPPDKLPEAARQVGKTIAALRRFQTTMTRDFEELVAQGEPERDPTPTLPPKEPTPASNGAEPAKDATPTTGSERSGEDEPTPDGDGEPTEPTGDTDDTGARTDRDDPATP